MKSNANSPLLVVVVLATLLLLSPSSVECRLLKDTKGGSSSKSAKKMKRKPKMPEEMTVENASDKDGYVYQRKADAFLTEIDNMANENPDDVGAFYEHRVAAFQTDDIIWDIDAGARKFQLEGKEAVGGLFSSFSTRKFSFHQWSHYEINELSTGKMEAACRYHGVVLEAEGNYQDIFGVVKVHFNTDNMIDFVFVQRFHTIDRGSTS